MAELEITFLGTGTSQGIPMIGCQCAVCTSADPRDNRTRSSIHVRTPECSWVVDTGPDFRIQCLREGVATLDAVIYTHSHTDHIVGFDDLRSFTFVKPIPIYAAASTMDDLRRVFMFAFDVAEPIPGYIRPDPHLITGPFQLGGTRIIPLPAEHGRAHVFGYLFEREGRKLAVYLSDCKRLAPEVEALIEGVDLLIIDALRHRSHPTHMNLEEALALTSRIRPRQTWFTHLCHELGHAETEATLPAGVKIAYDGLKICAPLPTTSTSAQS